MKTSPRYLLALLLLTPLSSGFASPTDILELAEIPPSAHPVAFAPEAAEPSDPDAMVDIPDAALRRALEAVLGKNQNEKITRGDMASLYDLRIYHDNVAELVGLEHAINLYTLAVSGAAIADLRPLAGLVKLTWLVLRDNAIADAAPLAGLTSLTTLALGGNAIADAAPLAGLTSLTNLQLGGNAIADAAPLAGLTSLTTLTLDRNAIADAAPLAGLTSLTYLQLGGNAIADLSPLADLWSLSVLGLRGNAVSDLTPLVSNNGLGQGDVLVLEHNLLSWRSISDDIPALQQRGVEVRFDAPEPLSPGAEVAEIADPAMRTVLERALNKGIGWSIGVEELAEVTELYAKGLGIEDLAGIEHATDIEYLDLSGNSVTDIAPLASLNSLQLLYLDGNGVSDIASLAGLPLAILSLSGNPELRDYTPLSSMDDLYWLALDDNALRELPVLPSSLRYLYLTDNSFSDVGALRNLQNLVELRLSGNSIRSLTPLAGMSQLRHLHLNDNQVENLAPLNLESLEELHLRGNGVRNLEVLVAGQLKTLDVRGNPLSSDGLRILGDLRDTGATVLAGETVPYFPTAGTAGREGFVRVVNHSEVGGEVLIEAVDDAGLRLGPVRVRMDARTALHFDSSDLEHGNRAKGLNTGVGAPSAGDWRLELVSPLDIEVLSYVRTEDGLVTPMHDVATRPMLPFVNPGSNQRQRSFVRVVNTEGERGLWTSGGYDDGGRWRPMSGGVVVGPGRAVTFTSAELENDQGLGDGRGKWRLRTRSFPWLSMSLLESPTGHLTNLSTVPDNATTLADGTRQHRVPLFPQAGGARHGFLRVINRSGASGEVAIEAVDDAGSVRGPIRVGMGALQTLHLNSSDLESGNTNKGLNGGVGPGEGDWRLALTSELDLLVLSYVRTADGFVTSMHDVAPRGGDGSHRVVFFNPGSNRDQVSKLRLVNDGSRTVRVAIGGIDDSGAASGTVTLSVGARRALYVTSAELEAGGGQVAGSLGTGAGKWRLSVDSDAPLTVMSLLESPTGHLANVSTGTAD